MKTADQARVSLLNAKKQGLEGEVAQLKQKLSSLDGLEARMVSFSEEIQGFNEDVAKLLATVDLADRKADFEIQVPSGYLAALEQRRLSLNLGVSSLMQDGDQSLAEVTREIALLTEQFQISDTKLARIRKLPKNKRSCQRTISLRLKRRY